MRLLIVGAGGHAKVVIDAAEEAGFEIAGVIGSIADAPEVLGHPVSQDREGVSADGFIVAIGDNVMRARTFAEHLATGLPPASVIHPSAILGRDVAVGDGTFIAAGVIVNAGARIGADTILNTGCTVDHDCVIGEHSHVGPQVALCGSVTLGEGVLLGVGSCASPGASVGDWSVVGAGAAVVGGLPARTVCVGVPARPLRATDGPARG
ncbi:MAG TPA: NeuD/PglB/VioB family sugar acetyltransferase [Coriobacteriia bacterium]